MEDDRLPIRRLVHVAFDAKPAIDRRRNGAKAVFGQAGAVQAAVREYATAQPADPLGPWRWRQPAIKRR